MLCKCNYRYQEAQDRVFGFRNATAHHIYQPSDLIAETGIQYFYQPV